MSNRPILNGLFTTALVFAAGSLVAAACGGSGGNADGGAGGAGSEKSCKDKSDCAPSEECENKVCVAACPNGVCIDTGEGGGSGTDTPDGGLGDVDDERVEQLRDASCAGWSGEAEPRPALLMFVVDVSTSMKQPDPSGSGKTKWEVTAPALENAISGLPSSTGVGLLFYPNRPTTPSVTARSPEECVNTSALVPLKVLGGDGSDQRKALTSSIKNTQPPNDSGTPTHDAYSLALHEISQSPLDGNRYVILLTDGQPTYAKECIGDGLPRSLSEPDAIQPEPIIDEISTALGDAVETFVIGAPGSEKAVKSDEDMRFWLSEAAEAGGTAREDCSNEKVPYCHYDMVAEKDFATGLEDALIAITEQVVPCDFSLPEPPKGEQLDERSINVVLTTGAGVQKLVYRNERPSCDEGWKLSEDRSRIILCSATCRRIKLDPKATLEALFGCASEESIE
jgi:hypothetical protein